MALPETVSAQKTPGGEAFAAPLIRRHVAGDELHRHDKTAGEKKFNWLTYTGVGYFANVGISLMAVYWAERMKSGQKVVGAFGSVFEKLGAKRQSAEFYGRKSFFLMGGFAVIPVMKWLEDHKVDLVKKFNREIYGAQVDTDPAIRQSERELEVAPRQSWASIISGRLLALVPFYATIGLLWSRTSLLSLATNPELRAMGHAGREALHLNHPQEFTAIASKGWYFDRPISAFARDIGKLLSSRGTFFDAPVEGTGILTRFYHGALSMVGKLLRILPEDALATRQIVQMEQHSPGTMQSVKHDHGLHDPIQAALPYYAVSEAITSAMVAWGLYIITRFTGPFFDKKQHHILPEDALPPAVATPAPAMGQPMTSITAPAGSQKLMDAPVSSLSIAAL